MRSWPLVIAISLAATSAGAAETLQRIKGRDITARFSGMELTDDVHWAYVFKQGGKLASFSMGKPGTGTWRVQNDELCLELPVDASRCFEVWVAGKKVELRREPALPEQGTLQKPQKRQ